MKIKPTVFTPFQRSFISSNFLFIRILEGTIFSKLSANKTLKNEPNFPQLIPIHTVNYEKIGSFGFPFNHKHP